MRVLLCFSGAENRDKNRVVEMPQCPKAGETLETGAEAWLVETVVTTPEDPNHDVILHLRSQYARNASGARLGEGARLILHVEDDDGDEFFVRRAVKRSGAPLQVIRVADGSEAIAYLEGEGQFIDRNRFPLPEAVLLDLKMPRMTGYEVLEWLRNNPAFRNLPVIVLTSSSLYKDRERVLAMGATAFVIKTTMMEAIPGLVLQILEQNAPCEGDAGHAKGPQE